MMQKIKYILLQFKKYYIYALIIITKIIINILNNNEYYYKIYTFFKSLNNP